MSFSDFLENELLDHVWSAATYSAPANIHVALSTTTPNDDGTNFTEPASNYARVQVTNNATEWPAASGGAKSNANDITFVAASGSWGTITHFGMYDAATMGNLLAWGALNTSKAIDSGDTAKFAATDLAITLD